MFTKLVATAALTLGFSVSAHAVKIFEWNDPILGNYPPECSASQTYGTGGGGQYFHFQYDEYTVNCPGHPAIVVSRYQNWQGGQWGTYTCDLYTNNSNYTMSWNHCNNWRIYD